MNFPMQILRKWALFYQDCGQKILNLMSYTQSCDKEMIPHLRQYKNKTASKTETNTLKSRIRYNEDYPTSALHIFSNRANVQKHNEMMINSSRPSTYSSQAITNIQSTVTSFDVDSSVCDIPKKPKTSPQARIMVVRNIDVADGSSMDLQE